MKLKRIGVLTGGGDAPALNSVIRGIVYAGEAKNTKVIGFRDGWKGAVENLTFPKPLTRLQVGNWISIGGTLLGSSRTNPYNIDKGPQQVAKTMQDLNLDGLIAIGGDDTLGVADKLAKEGIPVVGVPKTIDNDVGETDYCLGFDTATNRAMTAIETLHTTARSHHRVIVVEIMGRHAGWITLVGGLAGNAHIILIPERPLDLDHVYETVRERMKTPDSYAIIAASEGVTNDIIRERVKSKEIRDSFGNIILAKLNIGAELAKMIEEETGAETRHVVLGHLQRSGPPTAFDRFLGTRFGVKAYSLLEEKKYGYMAVLKNNAIHDAPIVEGIGEYRVVDPTTADLISLLEW